MFVFLCLILVFNLASTSMSQTRDPNKIYKVAILPFLIHSQENLDYLREGIHEILSSRISVEGRIVVVDRSIVERALYEERPMRLDEKVATKIGMRVDADYIVLGSLTKIGNYISLDARLIDVSEEKPPLGVYTQHKGIDDVMVKIGDFAQDIGFRILGRRAVSGRSPETKHPYLLKPERQIGRIGPEGLGFNKSQTFNFEIKGLDIGDVDGDKKNEVVVMDSHNLYVFRYDGEKLSLLQKMEMGFHNNFLTLDVADVNRNGFAEIVVTSVVEDDLRSFILEYEEGKFRKITERAGWYFRVIEHPKDGPILMGQKMGADGLFVGPVYQMRWKNKSFETGPKMVLPKGTNIFDFTMADIRRTGKTEVLVLDRFDRLTILSEDGKTLWRGGDRYGGSNNYYDTRKKIVEGFRQGELPNFRVYLPGRIIVKDLDGDGIPEVIINKNEFATGKTFDRMRIYEKGEIHNLTWEDDALVMQWKTREMRGYIADYQVKDAENDGEDELVVAVAPVAEEPVISLSPAKARSNIYFFKLF